MAKSMSADAYLKGLNNAEKGERGRSLLDLIELKTFDLELAAWCTALVSGGASYLAGSGPGGVGKTTTMHSLLSFVPQNLHFAAALPGEISPSVATPHCAISHELSDHGPSSYLWDQDLRDFLALSEQGHLLTATAHADDLEEIHGQIVVTNQVPEEQFRSLNLLIFICLEGGNPPGGRVKDTETRRVINKIFYSDRSTKHQLVYTFAEGLLPSAPRDAEREGSCRAFFAEALLNPKRNLDDVRHLFLEWQAEH
jgi:hypothetical protein